MQRSRSPCKKCFLRSVRFFHSLSTHVHTKCLLFASFVVVSLLNTRHQTSVSKRTSNPEYKDAPFDFALYVSLADRLGALEIVVWDKDSVLRKEYLGEVALPLEDWFREESGFGFYDERNKVLPSHLLLFRLILTLFAMVAALRNARIHPRDHTPFWYRPAQGRLRVAATPARRRRAHAI